MAAADVITVNVRLLPSETSEHAHLTRFQRGKRSEVTGPTLRLQCKPSDTVATLKKLIVGANPPSATPPPVPRPRPAAASAGPNTT